MARDRRQLDAERAARSRHPDRSEEIKQDGETGDESREMKHRGDPSRPAKRHSGPQRSDRTPNAAVICSRFPGGRACARPGVAASLISIAGHLEISYPAVAALATVPPFPM